MKRSILLVLTCLTASLSAQTDFQRLYHPAAGAQTIANSIQPIAGGGFVMAGRDSATAAQGYDAYLLKIAANGDTVWARSYGASGDEYGQCAVQGLDGGYLMAGISIGVSADVYLVKTNANGDTVWTRILGLAGDDEANFVQKTNDGNFIVAGYTNSSGAGGYDYFLLKIDYSGNVLWSKTYGTALDELAYTVFPTLDNGYIVGGAAMTPAGNIDVYAVKTDANGVEQWSKYYGTTDTDWGYMMRPTLDGGYVLTGYVGTAAGWLDALLIKTNSAGDTLWTGTYGSWDWEQGLSVIETNNGGYAVSGSVYYGSLGGGDAMLLLTDNGGHLQYCRGFGGIDDDWSASLLQLGDNSFVLGGYSNSFSGGKYDYYLVQTDTGGHTAGNCNEAFTSVVQTQASIATTTLTSTVMSLSLSPVAGVTMVDSMMMQAEGCSSLGVQQVSAQQFSFDIYPNPSSGAFSIKADHVTSATIKVTVQDMMGKCFYAATIHNETGAVNRVVSLGDLPPGAYFVRMVAGDRSHTTKLMILK